MTAPLLTPTASYNLAHDADIATPAGLPLNPIRAFLHGRFIAPGLNRNGRGRILRRTFNHAVSVDHIDQHVSLSVAAAHDLHLLEKQRAALAKHVFALREFRLEMNRPDLPAGERNIGNFLRHAQPAL